MKAFFRIRWRLLAKNAQSFIFAMFCGKNFQQFISVSEKSAKFCLKVNQAVDFNSAKIKSGSDEIENKLSCESVQQVQGKEYTADTSTKNKNNIFFKNNRRQLRRIRNVPADWFPRTPYWMPKISITTPWSTCTVVKSLQLDIKCRLQLVYIQIYMILLAE